MEKENEQAQPQFYGTSYLSVSFALTGRQEHRRCSTGALERRTDHSSFWHGDLVGHHLMTGLQERGKEAQHTSSFSTRLQAGSELMFSCALPLPLSPLGLFERDFSQPNPLDRGPDDR
jgi:hypothetical protein